MKYGSKSKSKGGGMYGHGTYKCGHEKKDGGYDSRPTDVAAKGSTRGSAAGWKKEG